MSRLADRAVILRSKNAGIGLLAIDALFADRSDYEAAVRALTRERVAAAYNIRPEDIVQLVHFEAGLAVKVTLPRPRPAGGDGLGETDLYGGGQTAPIADLEI